MVLDGLLRELTPQVLGAVVRRTGDFTAAEDAVQEALIAAARTWPRDGIPDNPRGWLIQSASRRFIDEIRQEQARRKREELAAHREVPAEDVEEHDDTLRLLFLCCHPALTPASAIALTLRAVGGLTTAEIAKAYLVPEATMAQRITRAKLRLKGMAFELEPSDERLGQVLHVLYLLFNEGYTSSGGDESASRRPVRRGDPADPNRAWAAAREWPGHGIARADAAHRCPASGQDRPSG